MGFLEAILLGILQGLTEFLPVSSSGHLELGRVLLGVDEDGSGNLFFVIAMHAATALSTIVVFRKDIGRILWDVYTIKFTDNINLLLFIALSSIPAALVGFFLKDEIESLFVGNTVLVGSMLLFTGALLFISSRTPKKPRILDYKRSLLIGVAQAIAILPGVSRSGATIATGLMIGIRKKHVARFSFLMVLPLILGATLKEAMDYDPSARDSIDPLVIGAGFAAAFFSGLFACRWMILLVRRSKFWYFSIYCFVVGTIAIIAGIV